MAIQRSVAARDAANNSFEATVGVSAVIKLFTGTVAANCAAANPAGLVATLTLPSDWCGASSSGTTAKAGTWTGTGSGAGTAASYRLYASDGTTCHEQGTVGQGSGDLSLDNTVIANGQAITITQWDRTAGNA
jgi:hypothetical protein